MLNKNNNFVPIKGTNWHDVMNWIQQSSPRHVTFMKATINTLKSVCRGKLPYIAMDGKVLVMTWNEGRSLFRLRSKISLIHVERSDLEWSICDHDGNLVSSGSVEDANWWPDSFIFCFDDEWDRIESKISLIFQLGVVSIITMMILSSLFLI